MYTIEKQVDINTGKVTYTCKLGSHVSKCIATCDTEAKQKLELDIFNTLGLDGIIATVKLELETQYSTKARNINTLHEGTVSALQTELQCERTKSWWQKFWSR